MIRRWALAGLLLAAAATPTLQAWGAQGHRLVASIAANHLNAAARRNVASLLGTESLADVASWADDYRSGVTQTGFWHYVNVPPDARAYDRDRDCPRQPGVTAGSRDDAWRDCIVDRILYNETRLADTRLDRADRAIALKFLVHFLGDIHQPFHASAIERGGNGILVRYFGADSCDASPQPPQARPAPCNLHAVWDARLIARRELDDRRYLSLLEQQIRAQQLFNRPLGTPAEWAMESLTLSNAAMLPQKGEVNDAYFRAHIGTIEQRLALGGVRLAGILNRTLGDGVGRPR